MTEQALKAEFNRQIPFLEAWGKFVVKKVDEELERIGCREILYSSQFRVKEVDSFINKALYRGKNYGNPIKDIEDKVGVRCMVLLSTELEQLSNAIEDSSCWQWRLDRNYENDKRQSPELFSYQSKHYILESIYSIKFEDIEIPAGIKCELQVRTLLQHIYAEISHNSIYKSDFASSVNSSEMTRTFSKAMALLEVTDQLLVSVKQQIEEATNRAINLRSKLECLWEKYHLHNYPIDIKVVNDVINMLMPCCSDLDIDGDCNLNCVSA